MSVVDVNHTSKHKNIESKGGRQCLSLMKCRHHTWMVHSGTTSSNACMTTVIVVPLPLQALEMHHQLTGYKVPNCI